MLTAQLAPHSWDLEHWPEHVWPHTRDRARYIIRVHKLHLIGAGALSRVGREFVVMGAQYTRWLQRQGSRAAKFEIAPTRARNQP
jgi:hypothetical protein